MSEFTDPPEDDMLAAEYALGVLDSAGRIKAERRMRHDAVFARAVDDWQNRLGPMVAAAQSVAPPAGLWESIDGDLGRILRVRAAFPPRAEARATTGRRVSGAWQWLGLGSLGVAAASLAALLVAASPGPPVEPLTASLAGESGPPLYAAVVYPGSASATLVPIAVGADPAHAHELWLIEPGKAPLSLGVLAQQGTLRIEIPPALVAKGGVLAITLEPLGGSPTGNPTGPVVAQGELQAI
ncbi:anti-sigma K factor RskA [Aureimonas sp. SA4125]|uniref:anti-sigma factor n=1 Tax=Aureimonas sp. SA4125 TaxID=2826993 RepID=UPI001CC5E383|nr:anti-sigma factor [Aureimonas sp. SA4125]BDA82544.1 anti-sigma K factor RskA [Aureimonas sp. SA4125]